VTGEAPRTDDPGFGGGLLVQGLLCVCIGMLTSRGDAVRSCVISFVSWDVGLLILRLVGYRRTRVDRDALLLGPVLLAVIAVLVELIAHMD